MHPRGNLNAGSAEVVAPEEPEAFWMWTAEGQIWSGIESVRWTLEAMRI